MSEQVAELKERVKKLEDRVFRLEQLYWDSQAQDLMRRSGLLADVGEIERKWGMSPTTKELRDAAK